MRRARWLQVEGSKASSPATWENGADDRAVARSGGHERRAAMASAAFLSLVLIPENVSEQRFNSARATPTAMPHRRKNAQGPTARLAGHVGRATRTAHSARAPQ